MGPLVCSPGSSQPAFSGLPWPPCPGPPCPPPRGEECKAERPQPLPQLGALFFVFTVDGLNITVLCAQSFNMPKTLCPVPRPHIFPAESGFTVFISILLWVAHLLQLKNQC